MQRSFSFSLIHSAAEEHEEPTTQDMSYTFTWPHAAEEVFVTGTFDNWAKTVRLEKQGTVHAKTVNLPQSDDKILYKFVADGEWKHDHTGKTETDHEGNINNVLYPADIQSPSAAAAAISSVAPQSSTNAMAAEQPLTSDIEKEGGRGVDAPGAFPETPAANDGQTFSVNPIPVSSTSNPVKLNPGENVPDVSTISRDTMTSGVHDDPELKAAHEEEQTMGVAPLPAMGGIGNPIHLAPGEKVPDSSTLTGHSLTSNVKLDKESYEKSDSGAPVLPPVLSPQSEQEAFGGAAMFSGLGPQTTNMIPESSMGMGSNAPAPISDRDMTPMMSSVAPQSTTNQLAGQVPLESERAMAPTMSSVAPQSTTNQLAGQVPPESERVPGIVTDSQQSAGVDPEAASSPQAVQEKSEMEDELHNRVHEAPVTSEGPADAEPEAVSNSQAMQGKSAMENELQQRVHEAPVTSEGPSDAYPEAASNPQAVQEKSAMEDELHQRVHEAPVTSEGPLAADSEAASSPQAVQMKSEMEDELHRRVHEAPVTSESTSGIAPGETPLQSEQLPAIVSESQQTAGVDPEAASSSRAVQEKDAMESELHNKVPEAPVTSESHSDSNMGMMGAAAGGLAGVGAAAGAAAYAMRNQATKTTGRDPVSFLPESVQKSINSMNTSTDANEDVTTSRMPVSTPSDAQVPQQTAVGESVKVPAETSMADKTVEDVPEEVVVSQKEAHVDPEASTNAEAVHEKTAVEQELLKKVPESEAHGEPAPATSAALAPTAPVTTGAPQLADPVSNVGALSMDDPIEGSKELNAPASEPAVPPTPASNIPPTSSADKVNQLAAQASAAQQSRDVSPMTKAPARDAAEVNAASAAKQEQPQVTTGVASSPAPAVQQSKPVGTPRTPGKENAATPQKRNSFMDRMRGTPESGKSASAASPSGSGTAEKKKGFFGRLKEKLK